MNDLCNLIVIVIYVVCLLFLIVLNMMFGFSWCCFEYVEFVFIDCLKLDIGSW